MLTSADGDSLRHAERAAKVLRSQDQGDSAMGEAVGSKGLPGPESRERLLSIIRGFRMTQAVYVATRLGIPDLLADGPRDLEELAQETDSHPPSLRRLLSALAAFGVLEKVGPQRFALTEVGLPLRTGIPGSLRPNVLFSLNEAHWRPWGHLLHTVRTGETAFNHVHGSSLFEFLDKNPEEANLFNMGMMGNSPAHARLVAAAYDFSRMGLVVDVAGGRGRLLATILERNAHLRGILFDLPHVVESARELIAEAGVIDRCDFVSGNFFETVPDGGDAYVLRNIIHDWGDDQAVAILMACRRAMADGARLVLVERYVPDDPREAPMIHHADLEMLVNVGGQERTTDEYATLLTRSGLRLARTIPLGAQADAMGHYLIEAQPA
jgi:SAM-dependent methyltransferase